MSYEPKYLEQKYQEQSTKLFLSNLWKSVDLLMNFSRNQIIGGLMILILLWAVILFRVLSSGT